MIRRLFGRWLVRLVIIGIVAVMTVVQGWAGAVLGWAAFAYLLWRAWPGVSRDFRRLWRGLPSRSSSGISRF